MMLSRDNCANLNSIARRFELAGAVRAASSSDNDGRPGMGFTRAAGVRA
jgi:hypothetical protein